MSVGKLSLLIPCFNEEANIDRYAAELFPPLDRLNIPVEYIFVDDGSRDGTLSRLKILQESDSRIRVVRHEENRGLGAAIRSGLKVANGDAVMTMDADLTFLPQEAPLLLNAYTTAVDCVLGSPILGRMEGVSAIRVFLSRAVNKIYQMLWLSPITASSSIFRLYRAEVVKPLNLRSDSFNINAEILFELMKKKARFTEVPVVLQVRKLGRSNIRFFREIRNHLIMFVRIISWRIHQGIAKKGR